MFWTFIKFSTEVSYWEGNFNAAVGAHTGMDTSYDSSDQISHFHLSSACLRAMIIFRPDHCVMLSSQLFFCLSIFLLELCLAGLFGPVLMILLCAGVFSVCVFCFWSCDLRKRAWWLAWFWFFLLQWPHGFCMRFLEIFGQKSFRVVVYFSVSDVRAHNSPFSMTVDQNILQCCYCVRLC